MFFQVRLVSWLSEVSSGRPDHVHGKDMAAKTAGLRARDVILHSYDGPEFRGHVGTRGSVGII